MTFLSDAGGHLDQGINLEWPMLCSDLILLVYTENNKGLRTEPWGVPVLVVIDVDRILFTIVLCVLPVRKLDTQFVTLESRCCSSEMRLLTLMVLKADEKSRKKHLA